MSDEFTPEQIERIRERGQRKRDGEGVPPATDVNWREVDDEEILAIVREENALPANVVSIGDATRETLRGEGGKTVVHFDVPVHKPLPKPRADDLDSPKMRAAVERLNQNSINAAVSLKIKGASYAEIAEVLEYESPAYARAAVERALAQTHDDEDKSALRNLSTARLEKLAQALAPTAMNPTVRIKSGRNDEGEEVYAEVANPELLPASRQYLAVLDRMIKLHGLDAPTQLQFVDPKTEEFARVVEMVARATGEQIPIEGDIEDAEIVEGNPDD
jgi:hypothetical protein